MLMDDDNFYKDQNQLNVQYEISFQDRIENLFEKRKTSNENFHFTRFEIYYQVLNHDESMNDYVRLQYLVRFVL